MPVVVDQIQCTATHTGAAPRLDVVSVSVALGKGLPVLILKNSGDVVQGWDGGLEEESGRGWLWGDRTMSWAWSQSARRKE